MTHTAGPWIAEEREHTKDTVEGIPYMHIQAGKGFATEGFELCGFITMADASLMAAAPDLLAALQNILNGITTGGITSDHDETFSHAITMARQAITKATEAL